MSIKREIKIIKNHERQHEESPTPDGNDGRRAERKTRREASATVTGWVEEHRRKRRAEAERAVKGLFPEGSRRADKKIKADMKIA